MHKEFSDYIVYVDESGDHSLKSIDPEYPVFVLAFCIFHKTHYSEDVVSDLQKFKFKHFGHDSVVLHEHEIRKEKGDFSRLFKNKADKTRFLEELTSIINDNNFILTCCVIDKLRLKKQGGSSDNPYHLALEFGLEKISHFLEEKGQHTLLTHIIVEQRGPKEDAELELEFRRLCSATQQAPFDIKFVNKKANSAGLQLADLIARPVGRHILKPDQTNRAFEALKPKFFCEGGRKNAGAGFVDWGLVCFPKKEP